MSTAKKVAGDKLTFSYLGKVREFTVVEVKERQTVLHNDQTGYVKLNNDDPRLKGE